VNPFYKDDNATIYNADAIDVYPLFEPDTFDLLFLDPPYYKVKMECAWDRQWDTATQYLEWMGQHAEHWNRILKPNGSLFVCASPGLSWQVQSVLQQHFNVLNAIIWEKEAGWHHKAKKDELRSYTDPTETIFFCEHYGADNVAKDGAGYETACQELLCRIFQIGSLCERHSITRRQIGELIVEDYKNIDSAKAQASNWILGKNIPNRIDFDRLKTLIPICGEYEELRTEYEELRTEYEELRTEYEELRRPFFATPERPFTSVWHYETVQPYDGKHPAEKPLAMLRDVIQTTTRDGAIVGDFFMGSGTTLAAGIGLGRKVYGCDMSAHWCGWTQRRIETPPLFKLAQEAEPEQLALI
jgi:adenine-specific DNA-methyltransferase